MISSTNTNYPLDNIPDVYVCLVDHNAPDGTSIGSIPAGEEIIGSTYGGWWNYFYFAGAGQYAQHTNYYVPKIKFSINWDFIIPGGARKNLLNEVSAIEFGIGDTPDNIKASGIAVLSVKTEDSHTAAGGWITGEYSEPDKVREFDYQPIGFAANQFGTNGVANIFASGFPKYPYAGYSSSTTRQKEVRNIFTFYSARS